MNLRQTLLLFVGGFLWFGHANGQARTKLPAARTKEEWDLLMQQKPLQDNPFQLGKSGRVMPPNVRYPGEFEESQAVAMAWTYDYDGQGRRLNTVDTSSIYGFISAQCAKYISDELPVWIRIPVASDSIKVKTFMSNLGWPLTRNYRFFVTTGDDWWIRDFGPNGIYYGANDDLAFVDLKYYAGRDYDNLYPSFLAQKLGYPNFVSTLNGEGGNLMSDGFGRVYTSSMTTEVNSLSSTHNPRWDSIQTLDTLKNLFNASEMINLTTLRCDGGTGHIDLFVKLIDEQTMFVAEYPNQVTAGDRKIVEDNYQYLASLKSTYNRPFRIYRIPLPTDDFGNYTTTCAALDNDARTFINGITANKSFIYPSYSDDIDGNQGQNAEVQKLFKKLMPGYKIVPIDSRAITANGGGGAIHCITMQIPAENPVLFWHPSVDGLQPIRNKYHIVSKITNRSGIKTAECRWRKRLDPAWKSFQLTDSAGYFIGDIEITDSLTDKDWFIYYLSAITNNGKTAVKPITAPDGYYQVYFRSGTDSLSLGAEELKVVEKDHLFGAYPNPSAGLISIPYKLISAADVRLTVTDMTGKVMLVQNLGKTAAGMHKADFDISSWAAGMYFYSISINNEPLDARRFIKN